jgi:hypothetical protein
MTTTATPSRHVLARDPWDDTLFANAVANGLGPTVTAVRERGDPEAGALVADLFASYYKLAPSVDAASGATRHHRDLVEAVRASREYEALRASTRLSPAEAALATATTVEKILSRLPKGQDADARRRAIREAVAAAGEAVAGAQALEAALGLDGDGPAGLGGGGAATQDGPKGPGGEIARLLALHEHARKSPALQRVVELAGRMTRVVLSKHRARPRHGPDEVHDVEQGGDLGRLLPSELMALASRAPALRALRRDTLVRFSEKKTAQYALRSVTPEHKGPLVVCLDESGSMWGRPAEWAEALALALMALARKEKRAFALVTFHHEVTSVQQWPTARATVEEITAVLGRSSGGGTDFQHPLERGLELIKGSGAFKTADLIVVTDGDAPTDGWGKGWRETATKAGVRLWAVLIGAARTRLNPLADGVAAITDLARDDAVLTMVSGL